MSTLLVTMEWMWARSGKFRDAEFFMSGFPRRITYTREDFASKEPNRVLGWVAFKSAFGGQFSQWPETSARR
jgi:hypothetical protein